MYTCTSESGCDELTIWRDETISRVSDKQQRPLNVHETLSYSSLLYKV